MLYLSYGKRFWYLSELNFFTIYFKISCFTSSVEQFFCISVNLKAPSHRNVQGGSSDPSSKVPYWSWPCMEEFIIRITFGKKALLTPPTWQDFSFTYPKETGSGRQVLVLMRVTVSNDYHLMLSNFERKKFPSHECYSVLLFSGYASYLVKGNSSFISIMKSILKNNSNMSTLYFICFNRLKIVYIINSFDGIACWLWCKQVLTFFYEDLRFIIIISCNTHPKYTMKLFFHNLIILRILTKLVTIYILKKLSFIYVSKMEYGS